MTLVDPIPFEEALRILVKKGILTTDMSSAMLRQLSPGVRARSVFSAKLNQADVVQRIKDMVIRMASPQTEAGVGHDLASVRAELGQLIQDLGYHPATGFPGAAVAHEAAEGSLQDFSSLGRLNLILKTQIDQVFNAGFKLISSTPSRLYQFPCYELLRIGTVDVPRGFKRGKGGALVPVPDDDWQSRWVTAGGDLVDGRMVAKKDDPIWEALGDSDTFDDALDTAYPPYAFNSQMGWREIGRAEAIDLGVVDPDEGVDAMPVDLVEGLKADAKQFDPGILAGLKKDFFKEIGGKLVMKNERPRSTVRAHVRSMLEMANAADPSPVLVRVDSVAELIARCEARGRARLIRNRLKDLLVAAPAPEVVA